jgi:hypothetical protein
MRREEIQFEGSAFNLDIAELSEDIKAKVEDVNISELWINEKPEFLGVKYPRIHLDFLSQYYYIKGKPKDKVLPKFAVHQFFNQDDYVGFGECVVSTFRESFLYNRGYLNLTIPVKFKSRKEKWASVDTPRLKAPFIGVIPQAIKARIQKAAPEFEKILLIREAGRDEWQPVPVNDPLIVGRSKDRYYLIAKFDCTSAEEYVSREFTE